MRAGVGSALAIIHSHSAIDEIVDAHKISLPLDYLRRDRLRQRDAEKMERNAERHEPPRLLLIEILLRLETGYGEPERGFDRIVDPRPVERARNRRNNQTAHTEPENPVFAPILLI